MGHEAHAWSGRCAGCGEWNTLVDRRRPRSGSGAAAGARPKGGGRPWRCARLGALAVAVLHPDRRVDRVLGGGLVPGSLVLLGGSPGIGKSTLIGMALGNSRRTAGALLRIR